MSLSPMTWSASGGNTKSWFVVTDPILFLLFLSSKVVIFFIFIILLFLFSLSLSLREYFFHSLSSLSLLVKSCFMILLSLSFFLSLFPLLSFSPSFLSHFHSLTFFLFFSLSPSLCRKLFIGGLSWETSPGKYHHPPFDSILELKKREKEK